MNRIASLGIGSALVVLGIVGLSLDAAPWLSWSLMAGGLWSFVSLAIVRPNDVGNIAVAWPALLASALLIVGLSAVTAHASLWLTLATFAAGIAATLEAIAARPGGFHHRTSVPQ